ncbi:hypothetical protein F2274_17280 [Salmonella enterica]|uniref:Uncharacterized protein n=1 Tax=Salmonella enterica TaxID=28901 RepID=A0A5V2HRM5_SALER|nr:hypothetical protein [Salmonella enterica]EDU3677591.1 hypothetical protein [Salmonella enterica subsp. enterica serovar Baildon]EHE7398332.1 hypothetical protein [Salmonella enterica subsp. enterica serovar Muenchen]EAW5910803.1 hypothetical protein [Salmonella enterica]EBA1706599.1 hypothetical protein [Salmonella enterica]
MAYWVSSQIDSFAGKINQGWFDIPNGWTTDSFGVVSFRNNAANGNGGDSELYLHGFVVSGSHMGYDYGYSHSCVCPRNAPITVSSAQGIGWLRYRRLGS